LASRPTDAEYFEPDLIDRLKARASHYRGRIKALLSFHTAYQRALLGEDGKLRPEVLPMLRDLAAFCLANGSTYHDDARRHAFNEGRRAVWLEIQKGLRFDRNQLESLNRQLQELDEDE